MNRNLSSIEIRIIRDVAEHFAGTEEDPTTAIELNLIKIACNKALADPLRSIRFTSVELVPQTTDNIVNYLAHQVMTNEWGSEIQIQHENDLYDYLSLKYCYNIEEYVDSITRATTEEALSFAFKTINDDYPGFTCQ